MVIQICLSSSKPGYEGNPKILQKELTNVSRGLVICGQRPSHTRNLVKLDLKFQGFPLVYIKKNNGSMQRQLTQLTLSLQVHKQTNSWQTSESIPLKHKHRNPPTCALRVWYEDPWLSCKTVKQNMWHQPKSPNMWKKVLWLEGHIFSTICWGNKRWTLSWLTKYIYGETRWWQYHAVGCNFYSAGS